MCKNNNSTLPIFRVIPLYQNYFINFVRSITPKLLEGFYSNFIHWQSTLVGSAVCKNNYFTLPIFRVIPLYQNYFINFVRSITPKLLEGFYSNFIQWQSTLVGSAVCKCNNSTLPIVRVIYLYHIYLINFVRSKTPKLLEGFFSNFIHWQSTLVGSALCKNNNSTLPIFRVIPLYQNCLINFVRSLTPKLLEGFFSNFIY
jgi:hypothetical protein